MKTKILILLTILMIVVSGCHKYDAQKTPWPVGYNPLYFSNGFQDYTPPLTVKAVTLNTVDIYDGQSNHYVYDLVDANNKLFTGALDYELGETPQKTSFWVWLRADGTKDSIEYNGKRDTFTMAKPTTEQLKIKLKY